jgi:hypothetical protein
MYSIISNANVKNKHHRLKQPDCRCSSKFDPYALQFNNVITPIIYVLSTGNYLLQDFCGWCYENNNSKPTPLFFEPFRLQMV